MMHCAYCNSLDCNSVHKLHLSCYICCTSLLSNPSQTCLNETLTETAMSYRCEEKTMGCTAREFYLTIICEDTIICKEKTQAKLLTIIIVFFVFSTATACDLYHLCWDAPESAAFMWSGDNVFIRNALPAKAQAVLRRFSEQSDCHVYRHDTM